MLSKLIQDSHGTYILVSPAPKKDRGTLFIKYEPRNSDDEPTLSHTPILAGITKYALPELEQTITKTWIENA